MKPVRLLRIHGLLRYTSMLWFLYEVLATLQLLIQPRFIVPARGIWPVLLYSAIDGLSNLASTWIVFAFLDLLSRRPHRRVPELLVLAVFMIVAAIGMVAFTAWVRSWSSPQLHSFAVAFPVTLRFEFHDAIMTIAFQAGLGNALRSWAILERRRVAEADIEAAVVRAEKDTLTALAQPQRIAAGLRRISLVLSQDLPAARLLIADMARELRTALGK